MVTTSGAHSAPPREHFFLFLPHFDVICDLLMNSHTATCDIFIKSIFRRDTGSPAFHVKPVYFYFFISLFYFSFLAYNFDYSLTLGYIEITMYQDLIKALNHFLS